jgi:DNA primase
MIQCAAKKWESAEPTSDNRQVFERANSADLIDIFKFFGLKIDQYNRKCVCPIPSHNDKTASFYYYKDTNSFFCFGCKNGGRAVEFVHLMQNINKFEAAKRIIEKFYTNPENSFSGADLVEEKHAIILEFSESIRNFIVKNMSDKSSLDYAERITLIFDKITTKNPGINLDGLKIIIKKLTSELKEY